MIHMSSQIGLAALAVALSSAAAAQAQVAAQTSPDAPVADATTPGDSSTATAGANLGEVGDIVVTAQKRSESLQKVPLAITAITSSELERSGIRALPGVAATVPGPNLGEQIGRASWRERVWTYV